MTPVALVTDSTACLAVGGDERDPLRCPADVRVVPLHAVSDGVQRSEPELAALPPEELVAFLSGRRLSTSRPSPQVFLDAYERAARAGAGAVVSVHLSGRLSGTVESARLAATAAPVPVEVVDSRTIGAALGSAVLAAHRAAARGADAPQVAATALACADAATVTFSVDSLEHLRRGGRIGAAQRLLGSALAMRPVLRLTDGVIGVHAKVRTTRRALDRLVEDAAAQVAAAQHGADVYVQSVTPNDDPDHVTAALRERCPGARVTQTRLGAVIGTHVGPGVVAVSVVPRLRGDLGAL